MSDLHQRVSEHLRTFEEPSDLEQRVAALERAGSYRIKLSEANLLRLQSGDVVVLRIVRPLADSETQRLAVGWRELMASVGHENVQLLVLSGVEADIGVVRQGESNGISQ